MFKRILILILKKFIETIDLLYKLKKKIKKFQLSSMVAQVLQVRGGSD